MTRPLRDFRDKPDHTEQAQRDNWLTRATARAFAAAVSSLLIATLVVNRSNEALATDGTAAGSIVSSGTISLDDDDAGRALFDFSDMAPGRPIVRCIEIEYSGTITPVDLSLVAESTGELSRYLDLTLESGTGAGFESCDGFEPRIDVYQGTLGALAEGGRIDLGGFVNSGQRRTYRITVSIQDVQEALGKSATADFIWEVTPS